jgi:hypothetical protein
MGELLFEKKSFLWLDEFILSFTIPAFRFVSLSSVLRVLYKGRVKNANREKAYILETSLIENQPARRLSSSQEVTKPSRSCVQCFVARDYIPPLLPFHTQWELYSPRKIVLPSSNNGACRYQTL